MQSEVRVCWTSVMRRKPRLRVKRSWQLLLLLLVAALSSLPPRSVGSTEFERADAELNGLYQQLRAQLSPERREGLRQAQRAWLAFLDVSERNLTLGRAFRTEETQARCEQLRLLLQESATAGSRGAAQLRAADAELNEVYQNVVTSLTRAEQSSLREAQRAWLAFYVASQRDTPGIAATIAQQRTDQLRQIYLKGKTDEAASATPNTSEEYGRSPPVDPTTPDPFERARRPR